MSKTVLKVLPIASIRPVQCYGCNQYFTDLYKVYFSSDETGEYIAHHFCEDCFAKVQEKEKEKCNVTDN